MKILTFATTLFAIFILNVTSAVAGGGEYTGQFDTALGPNTVDNQRVVFKLDAGDRLKEAETFDAAAHITLGKLIDPQTQQYTILAYLVEEKGKDPVIFVDSNDDHRISASEKYALKRNADDTYIWNATATLQIKEGMFKTCPVYIRYFKSVFTDKMSREDRLLTQSTEVWVRGKVNVKGKNVLVQYGYDFIEKKVDPQNGKLGVDTDENGEIDMDNLSPEATETKKETAVFRVGSLYLSTKKADVAKNQIVLREQEAKDYKRLELYMNKSFPDFTFTDFEGKKHTFAEFRGKYVLLDIWGFWCGPCKRELPYIREASQRFKDRNLAIVGLNTDDDYTIDQMKTALDKSKMTWTQAQFQSVIGLLREGLRVTSFPTTFLISPEGKILSMGRSNRDEPDLRGSDLLKTLDDVLPAKQ